MNITELIENLLQEYLSLDMIIKDEDELLELQAKIDFIKRERNE